MGYKLHLIAALLLAFFGTSCCQTTNHGIGNFSEEYAHRLMQHLNDIFWQSVPTYLNATHDVLSPKIKMREDLRYFYPPMQLYDWNSFADPLLTRQFEVILRGSRYPRVDSGFVQSTAVLQSVARKRWVCPKAGGDKCNIAYVQQIKSIFTNSRDPEDMLYYWLEWRNKMPDEVKNAFNYYVDYYKHKVAGNPLPSAVWYDEYDEPHFIDELQKLMQAIEPLYKALHAHLRYLLIQQYGEGVLPANGLIPHHLLEQAAFQAWKKESLLKNPFVERRLPNLMAEIDGALDTPFDLVNISLQFFESIGFANFTNEFIHKHILEIDTKTAGPDCKSKIFDFGEIELRYCPKVTYKKLLQTHGDVAHIVYALNKNSLPVGLNQEACPGFGNAIGEATILSVLNPKHLQKHLGLLHDYNYDDMLNLNRLYRLAVHTLLTVPAYFVHEQLWVDIIDGKIAEADINCHYWNLMQKYMGVEAPAQTTVGAYDMPYKFYEGIVDATRSTKKIFGEFFGYQIYRNLCLQIGEYQRGNAYKTLDMCDFANSTLAGNYLSQIMRDGATKSWRDIVKQQSPNVEAELSASAFLEYYQPVFNWLTEDNHRKNLQTGWTATDKCLGTPRAATAT